jgi:hypothetical protein
LWTVRSLPLVLTALGLTALRPPAQFLALNPAFLDDETTWKAPDLRRLCKELDLSTAGGWQELLVRRHPD